MKIEYLHSGCSDCPLIRIYGNEPNLINRLIDICDRLYKGDTKTYAIHELAGFEPIDEIKLFFALGKKDIGIKRHKKYKNTFECVLANETWAQVADLARPLSEHASSNETYFQWLDDTSNISLLLTTNKLGEW